MHDGSYARVSDEAIRKATGRGWQDWFSVIDREGGERLSHKEIAQMLHEKHQVSEWWVQMVTVGYEYAKGRRVIGETREAGFEIGVTKTLPISTRKAWKVLTSPEGFNTWLGKGANPKLEPGATFRTSEGTTGEVRTIRSGERLRLTWGKTEWQEPSTLQLTVTPRKSTLGTCIRFHQEKLPSSKEREEMRKHWQQVLERLAKSIGRWETVIDFTKTRKGGVPADEVLRRL